MRVKVSVTRPRVCIYANRLVGFLGTSPLDIRISYENMTIYIKLQLGELQGGQTVSSAARE